MKLQSLAATVFLSGLLGLVGCASGNDTSTETGGNGGTVPTGGGGSGASGGTGGGTETGGGGNPTCELPGSPTNPRPTAEANDVDPEEVTELSWDEADGATGYDVYLSDECPPPSYPNDAFEHVTEPALTGLTLAEAVSYCWQVVAVAPGTNCSTAGPVWSFTTVCHDPVSGVPEVTSDGATLPSGTTSGTYTLTFSEPVSNVETGVTWSAVYGSGTMGTINAVDAATYEVPFSGVADGDSYTLTVPVTVVDTCNNPLSAAVVIPITIGAQGGTCADAIDVTSATFPRQVAGTFDEDPVAGGTCAAYPTNAVFFTYTAPAAGLYRVYAENNTSTNAWSRLAIFNTATCSPYGTELACETESDTYASAYVELATDQEVLILFYTDNDTYTMVNPSITISAIPPGTTCSTAIDVTAGPLPYTATGTFEELGAEAGSCSYSYYADNAVWFTYTAPSTGWVEMTLTDGTASSVSTYVAVFEGTDCDYYGTELACESSATASVSAVVPLVASTTYLILFHPEDDTEEMLNPSIDIEATTAPEGMSCSQPIDASSVTFPYTASGNFSAEDAAGGSCDTTPTNIVWFSYTPGTTGWYQIDLENQTYDYAYSRVAVFETTACDPHGTELACAMYDDYYVSTTVELQASTSYLIAFYTDDDDYAMEDPIISIASVTPSPGELCVWAADISSASFPYVLTGSFDADPVGSSCEEEAYNTVFYSYTPPADGSYEITATNATSDFPYSYLAIFEGTDCSPYGTEVSCLYVDDVTVNTVVELTGSQPYLILFYTDYDYDTMEDPSITVAPFAFDPAEACSTAVDVTSATFPYTQSGTFDYESAPGGSCDDEWSNMVWWTYTAPSTGSYTISATNATTTNAYSRIAVFETAACSPHGTQVACTTANAKNVSTTASLSSGTTYLITFYTDANSYTMVDPTLTITGP